jgi:hypothetical protein
LKFSFNGSTDSEIVEVDIHRETCGSPRQARLRLSGTQREGQLQSTTWNEHNEEEVERKSAEVRVSNERKLGAYDVKLTGPVDGEHERPLVGAGPRPRSGALPEPPDSSIGAGS